MPENHGLNSGDEAPRGIPGTGKNICLAFNGSGKKKGGKCQTCAGTGKVIQGIGGA